MTDQPNPQPHDAKGLLSGASQAATSALDSVVDTAQAAARRTVESIEGNPLSVLVGGIAVGVLAGTLLPRTERETELLGPVGKRLTDGAAAAARAARDAGTAELVAAGISRDAARAQVGKLLDGVMTAVKTAGEAASTAAKPGTIDN
ncbi:hypothetical protein [Sphingomonas sp. 28-63-12]|uniref:hypothetical protein n=1 Tax=Sphingomonas sp. 28-63-12 TaxID=1970434 RepID=UPI000BD6C9A3|nr:MAG: hypothetical protein B7Y47_03565 [Sphingomonas sp. 28-63-12]